MTKNKNVKYQDRRPGRFVDTFSKSDLTDFKKLPLLEYRQEALAMQDKYRHFPLAITLHLSIWIEGYSYA